MSKEINTVAIEEILQRHGVDYTGGLIEELRRMVQNNYNKGYFDGQNWVPPKANIGRAWTDRVVNVNMDRK